jgi:hypothetical protein
MNSKEAELEFSRWLDTCIKDCRPQLGLSWGQIVQQLLTKAMLTNLKAMEEKLVTSADSRPDV